MQFRRALEVGKEHRDLLALPFQGGTGRQDFLGEMRGGVGQRPDVRWACPDRRRCGGWRRRCRHVAGPDQDVAILINGHLLGLDEFVLEIIEGVIVQLELPLERAIGHPAATLEHGQGLVENLLKGHGRPSTPLARVPQERNVRQGGVSRERAPRVYQEYGGVAGEIARSAGTVAWGRSGRSRKVSEKRKWPVALAHLKRYSLNGYAQSRGLGQFSEGPERYTKAMPLQHLFDVISLLH